MTGEDSAQYVRAIMERHKLTQAGVAEVLGVSRAAVSTWLRGVRAPDHPTRARIAYLYESPAYAARRIKACGVGQRAVVNNGRAWTEQEEATLCRMVECGELTQVEMAEELGRPLGSVKTKIRALRRGGVL